MLYTSHIDNQIYNIAADDINFFKFPIITCMACLFYDLIPDETGVL